MNISFPFSIIIAVFYLILYFFVKFKFQKIISVFSIVLLVLAFIYGLAGSKYEIFIGSSITGVILVEMIRSLSIKFMVMTKKIENVSKFNEKFENQSGFSFFFGSDRKVEKEKKVKKEKIEREKENKEIDDLENAIERRKRKMSKK